MLEDYPKRQPNTVRFPPFLPEEGMQDILAPEDHKQETISKDRLARHHHGNNAKKMEVAWANVSLRHDHRSASRLIIVSSTQVPWGAMISHCRRVL